MFDSTNHYQPEIYWWLSKRLSMPVPNQWYILTHWGRVTHICVGNLTIIGPDNGLSPGRRQAIIWTNSGILLIGPWGTNFSEILIGIQTFSFKKMHLKMSFAKWRPFYLVLNVLSSFYKVIAMITHVSELQQCQGAYRITPVDVNSRPSSCLTNFLLNGECCWDVSFCQSTGKSG